MTTYAPGTPCWADLGSPDPAASQRFYGELFGWTMEVSPEPEAGGYTTCHLDGDAVAAIGPLTDEHQPPAWMVYIATDDVDRVTAAVRHAGGTVLVEPTDVMGYGRLAVLHDPSGAVFALWQAGSMAGADAMGRAGSMVWAELATRDPQRARAFYGPVLAWKPRDMASGGADYTVWEMDGQPVGGMMPMIGGERPADLPAHWRVYFAVDDPDAVAARAGELGGTVTVAPTDTPPGRLAVITDPHGAAFSIIKPNPEFGG